MLDVFKMIETIARTNKHDSAHGRVPAPAKGGCRERFTFHSLRRDKPMVALQTAARCREPARVRALRPYARPFTGGRQQQKACSKVAERGTVFLDEIGGRDGAVLQVKLLGCCRAPVRRVGGLKSWQADIRVIRRDDQDLARLIAEGRFREDLYYRINVIPISLPPLRERREDIALLAEHFVVKYTGRWASRSRISHQAMECCWRTIGPATSGARDVMERAVALEPTPAILADSLPSTVRGETMRSSAASVAGGR